MDCPSTLQRTSNVRKKGDPLYGANGKKTKTNFLEEKIKTKNY